MIIWKNLIKMDLCKSIKRNILSPISLYVYILVVSKANCDSEQADDFGIITFDKPGTVFQKIIFDKSSGSLYVGAVNNLFRISTNMTLIQNTVIGPVSDSTKCDPTDNLCNSLSMTNNDVTILLMDQKYDKLLLCGSVKQGLCTFYDKTNLSISASINGGGEHNVVNYVGSRASVVARFGNLPDKPNEKVLYVAQEYDSRNMTLAPSAISSRFIKNNSPRGKLKSFGMEYVYVNGAHGTFKDIHKDVKSSYHVKYVHTFEYQSFSFYLTVQRQYIDTGNYSTRLVIVCNKDPLYNSYTEIELACRKKNGVTSFFNIAEAAYFGEIGPEFVRRFNIDPTNERVLYILFGKSFPKSSDIDEEAGSGLCLFTMTAIMREYQSGQGDCYQGHGTLLPWIHPNNIECKEFLTEWIEIDKDPYYCSMDARNDAVGRRGYDLQTDTNVTLDGHYATSILVQVQNEKTVAILGTAKGTILKVLIDGTNAPPYIDINIAPEGVPDPRVAKDIIFDQNGSHIYAMTSGRIAKVPIQTCDLYKDCGSCLLTRDALQCGWCGKGQGHCSKRTDCLGPIWSSHSCTPSFYNFEPRSGPVQGGTAVTLYGAYFGNATAPNSQVSVKVALEPCDVTFHNTTVIVCTTRAQKSELSSLVVISVVDNSKTTAGFEIRGEVNLGHINFSYKKVQINDVEPLLGPKSGGSTLTITGKNLDVGSKLDISAADLPCIPQSVDSDKILCKSSPLTARKSRLQQRKRSLANGPVRIIIDKVVLSRKDLVFHYEEDPYVTDVHPRKSILSGGINVTVSGGNLHVVHKPQMVIQDEGIGVNYFDKCVATEENMICSSPALLDTKAKGPFAGDPLILTLNFAMDGVADLVNFSKYHPELSSFEYHVDPVIYTLDNDDTVIKFYTNQNFLELEGKHLRQGIGVEDYNVTIGDDVCEVTSLKDQRLYCRPKVPEVLEENEKPRNVLVKVGYLEFNPGYIEYHERNINLLVASVLAPLLGIIAVLILIGFCFWLRKRQKGPFRPYGVDLPNVRYTANPDNADGRDRLWHSNPYASSPQVLRQRHVVEREQEPLIDTDCRKFLEDSRLLINRDDLLLLDIIGQGNFGCVFKGLLKLQDEKQETEVAVKTLKTLTEATYNSSADARSFLEEALRMREFDHPNILRLIGIALDKEEQPLVILPFMKHGDLLTYIRDETNSPTIKDLMDFGIQISEGMAYLSKLKFVHRDLAARNCMLNDSMEVQVADFGLSRDIYERDYYSSDGRKAKLPVKWMSLESLEKGIYNIKTDVWSYGVVLWELMTRGVTPYPEVDNWEIIKFLKPGRRMPQPAYCPDSLYRVMLTCWDPDPNKRPTFSDIVTTIHRIMYEMENRQEQHARNDLSQHIYSNVPTTQTYLYPTTLPNYALHGGNPRSETASGDSFHQSGDVVEYSVRDVNENEQSVSVLV